MADTTPTSAVIPDEVVATPAEPSTEIVKKSARVLETPDEAETDGSEDEEDDDYNIDQDESQ